MNVIKIGVDIDEVLAPFLRTMLKANNKKPVKYVYPYVYREILGITEYESQKMVYDFYESEAFKNMKPIRGSQAVLSALKKTDFELYAITGRQLRAEEQTFEWLDTHYPGIFTDCYLTNSFTRHEIKKVDIARILSLNYMIDDSIDICKECQNEGITALNFVGHPIYPWCIQTNISVTDWFDVHTTLTSSSIRYNSRKYSRRLSHKIGCNDSPNL
jgi:5'(3')-deoxyribonucleotidase